MKQRSAHYCIGKIALALIILTMTVGSSTAAVLLQDSFDRVGTLNGSSLDVGGTTWIAKTTLTTDGSSVPLTGDVSAYTSFAPTSGYIYEVKMDLTISLGRFFMGFLTNTTPGTGYIQDNPNVEYSLLQVRPTSSYYVESGSSSFAAITSSIGAGNGTYSIILDTSAPNWTYRFTGPTGTTSTYTFASNPSITYFGFGSQTTSTITVDNFEINMTPVPEPAAISLCGLSLAALLFLRATRRR